MTLVFQLTDACLDMFCVLFIINNSFQRYYEKSSIAQIQYCVLPYHITELYLSHLDPILCLCPCEMANFGLSVKIFRAYGSFFGLHSTVVEPLQYYRQLRLALTTYYTIYSLLLPLPFLAIIHQGSYQEPIYTIYYFSIRP